MGYEQRRKSWVHEYQKKFPEAASFYPLLTFVAELLLLGASLYNAYETAGNVSAGAVYRIVLALPLSVAGMIAGGVALLKRSKRPWLVIGGILLNALMGLLLLAVIAIGL